MKVLFSIAPGLTRLLATLVVTLASVQVIADQNDERLEDLFADLKSLDEVNAANSIANRIWDI